MIGSEITALKSSSSQMGGFFLVLEYTIEWSVTTAMGHHVWFKNSSKICIYCLTSVYLSPTTPNALDTKYTYFVEVLDTISNRLIMKSEIVVSAVT